MTNAELTAAVMRHLKITWTSEGTAAEVSSIMSRAELMLNDLLGSKASYEDASGIDLDLYLNMCLYLYNGLTVDEFMSSYGKTLTIARQFHVDPISMEDDEDEDE